jgi:hypothetical protein
MIPGSFRDPSGFLYYEDGTLYRQVNTCYREDYVALMGSGLYGDLVEEGLLIPHEETDLAGRRPENALVVLKPEQVPFVAYPYSWCFSELKDAALATLDVQARALSFGMSLKDASAFNIQFRRGKPVFIDTLSFERYEEGKPWVAYGQFCRHFLAPLALMSRCDVRLGKLTRIHIDGIPLDLASSLLPFSTRFRPSLLLHLHLHARSEKRYEDKEVDVENLRRVSLRSLEGLIHSLKAAVEKLKWKAGGTEWADYYVDTNYTEAAFEHKRSAVEEFLRRVEPETVWDLGANTGAFSETAAKTGALTVAIDSDPACVERCYLGLTRKGMDNLLPLWIDLANPSPSLGWELTERLSIVERGPADTVLALALVHHLAISNNVPLGRIADFFAVLCGSLIVEFVPKEDSQVRRLLATREDVFTEYDRDNFEHEFGARFELLDRVEIEASERSLYLMKTRH